MSSIESKWDYFRGESIVQAAYREQRGVDGGANFARGVDPPGGVFAKLAIRWDGQFLQ